MSVKTADSLTMDSDLGESYRRAYSKAVQEVLQERNVDPADHEEKGEFLDAILLLKSGFSTPTVFKKEDTNYSVFEGGDTSNSTIKENRRDSTPSETVTVTHPFNRLVIPIESGSSGQPITPVEGRSPDWSSQSNSSGLSSPPEILLTPEGWSPASSHGSETTFALRYIPSPSPTMARLEDLAGFADANFSAFDALLAVASVAAKEVNNSNDDMTLDKLDASSLILQLEKHRNAGAISGRSTTAGLGMFITPQGKAKAATPASPTKDDLLNKMEDQYRRSGMKPATALGALPITPSSTTKHESFFAPKHRAFKKTQPPEFPILTLSTAREPQDLGDDSDVTIADPNRSDGESDVEMTPAMSAVEKKKKKKPVHSQYIGPPADLLDSQRTDAIAMAAKTNHPGSLNDLPSILANPTPSLQDNSSQVNHQTHLRGQKSTRSLFNNFDGSSDQEAAPPSPEEQDWLVEPPSLLERYKRQKELAEKKAELERLRKERRIRDNDEMQEGLKSFKGRQRGWNGEHESVRQETLKEYYEEEDRKFSEAFAKKQAAAAARERTPSVGKQPFQPDYSRMKVEKVVATKAKQLEEAYNERIAQHVQDSQDLDDQCNSYTAQNYQKMMSRRWDHDEIKRNALAEQRAKVLEEQRRAKVLAEREAKFRKERWGKDTKKMKKATVELKAEPAKFEVSPTKSAFGDGLASFSSEDHKKEGEQVKAKLTPSHPSHSELTKTDSKPQQNNLKRKERDAEDQNDKGDESQGTDEVKDERIKKARKLNP